MKNSKGKQGIRGYNLVGIILLLIILPISIFSQQKTQAPDSLAIKKIKQVTREDSVSLSKTQFDTTFQDSIQQLKIPIPQDTTVRIASKLKPDYSNLELNIEINNGQQYARARDVILNLIAPHAKEMILGNLADLSDGGWQPFQSMKSWTLLEGDGIKVVYFRVCYPDSSVSPIIYDEIILDSTPPIAKFNVQPDSGIANETLFNFDATESLHNFDLLLRWDWEDDGVFDTDWSYLKQEVHQYRFGGGKKKVQLEIKDSGGWIVSTTREIIVYSRPYPDFNYSQDFLNPLQITFDASESGDYEDGNNLQFRWDFNADSLWDSVWSFDKIITHTFDPFTEIQVTVQAKDSQGFTNTHKQKIVNEYSEMVFIPAGYFIMGNNDYEIDERPSHEVYLDEFWINKYPVTNKQYATFLNEYLEKNVGQRSNLSNFFEIPGEDSKIQFDGIKYIVVDSYDHHPVINVTWHGAEAYCRFYGMRLPTEAEWEKAARGTDDRLYPWGNEIDSSKANYWDSGDPFDNGTTPIGFYNGQNYYGFQTSNSSSFFGCYDIAGNIREWVFDWYLRNYYSNSPGQNPLGPETGEKKVVRGGGYLFHANNLRVSFRYSMLPDKSANFIGFRCVKSKSDH